MGKPLSCKLGKHSWTAVNDKGVKSCKFCNSSRFVGININENLRCKLGFHSYENKVRGQVNTCKICGEKRYVRTRKEEFESGDPSAGA